MQFWMCSVSIEKYCKALQVTFFKIYFQTWSDLKKKITQSILSKAEPITVYIEDLEILEAISQS